MMNLKRFKRMAEREIERERRVRETLAERERDNDRERETIRKIDEIYRKERDR